MSHFAHIDPNTNLVTQVIVIEPDVLARAGGWPILGEFRPKEEFVCTSYNTQDGKFNGTVTGKETKDELDARKRKNFAGIGYLYDKKLDAFVPPQPFPSWSLDEKTGGWVAPKAVPGIDIATEKAIWNEGLKDWVIIR